jgi:integrase family protein with SAM-like domain
MACRERVNFFLRILYVAEVSRLNECQGGDSNPYGFLHQILSLARLPIPPPRHRVQSKAMKRRSDSDQTLPPRATVHAQKPQSLLKNHFAKFMPVRDSRNRRVRGLYQRNGRYYAQLWVDCGYGKKSPRRFPLFTPDNSPARTLQEAKEALEVKRHERREDALPLLGRKPIVGDYCDAYFEKARVQRKRPGTIENERQAIVRWRSHLGHLRIDKITTPMITGFLEKRLKGGAFGGRKLEPVSQRTANLDLMTLRNVLKAAIDDG